MIRDFLREIQGMIRVEWSTIRLHRIHDQYLRDEVRVGRWTTNEVQVFNTCRMWLQIIRLSEIVSPDGKRILPDYWATRNRPLASKLEWPTRGRCCVVFSPGHFVI